LIAGLKCSQAVRRRFGLKVDTNEDCFHCSELATRALMDAGYPHNREPAVTTPTDVSEFSCLGDKVELV
jgi:hypothetical protein